jgi:hypothetical protein
VADCYELDLEALHAAAQSALAAPDRVIVLEVRARTQVLGLVFGAVAVVAYVLSWMLA